VGQNISNSTNSNENAVFYAIEGYITGQGRHSSEQRIFVVNAKHEKAFCLDVLEVV